LYDLGWWRNPFIDYPEWIEKIDFTEGFYYGNVILDGAERRKQKKLVEDSMEKALKSGSSSSGSMEKSSGKKRKNSFESDPVALREKLDQWEAAAKKDNTLDQRLVVVAKRATAKAALKPVKMTKRKKFKTEKVDKAVCAMSLAEKEQARRSKKQERESKKQERESKKEERESKKQEREQELQSRKQAREVKKQERESKKKLRWTRQEMPGIN